MKNILTAIFKDPSSEVTAALQTVREANLGYQKRGDELSVLKKQLGAWLAEADEVGTALKDATAKKSELVSAVALGRASRLDLDAAILAQSREAAKKEDIASLVAAIREAIFQADRGMTSVVSGRNFAYLKAYKALFEHLRSKIITPDLAYAVATLAHLKARASLSAGVPDNFFEGLFEIRPDPTEAITREVEVFIAEQSAVITAAVDQAGK